MEKMGLAERRDHKPAQLSGGQQQRVAVARALICTPTVLFADEPTGNLDSAAGAGVLDLLRTAVDEDGQTTVMVTHDARAAATADRVLFLADGRVVADLEGPTEERDPRRDEGRGPGMIRVALKGLAARPVRTALTTLAIVVGVAFVCAAYTLTDTMSGAADTLTHAAYDGTDAVVVTKTAFRGSQTSDVRAQAPTISAGALEQVRHADGVALAVGDITDTAQVIGTDGKPVGTGPYFGVGFDATHARAPSG